MKNLWKKILWLPGGLFILVGLVMLTESLLCGLCFAACGISMLPVVGKGIYRSGIRNKKLLRFVVPTVFFLLAGATTPESEASTSVNPVQESVVETVEMSETEVTVEPTVIVTQEPTPEPTVTVTQEPTPEPTQVTVVEEYDMTVHFLDVGQGLSIFVQSDGQNLIYDGGDRKTSSFVVSYLKQQNVTEIDYLISSHYDADHVAGLIGCLYAFDVQNVIGSNYVHDSDTYDSFMEAVAAEGLQVEYPSVGTSYTFGTGSFTILAPDGTRENESNDNSVAIQLKNGENSFIFTGDAEYSSEAKMAALDMELYADVLVPGHHGSATATSWDFLEACVPEYAVISCGAGNSYGHPHKDTLDKLEVMGVQLYRTDKQGTIVVESDGTDLRWNTEPCNDFTPGEEQDAGTQPDRSEVEEAEEEPEPEPAPAETEQVWVSATGNKYHNKNNCGNMNPDKARQISREEAENRGMDPCKKCYPGGR